MPPREMPAIAPMMVPATSVTAIVGAERMIEGWRAQPRGEVDLVDRHAPDQRTGKDGERQQRQDHHADRGQAMTAEAPEGFASRRESPLARRGRERGLNGRRYVGQASHTGYR